MRVLRKDGKLEEMSPKKVDLQKAQVILVVEANYSELEALFELGFAVTGSKRGALVLSTSKLVAAA